MTDSLDILRFSRAYTLTIEAAHTMVVGRGGIRERLKAIDPEFFSLRESAFPDHEGLRVNVSRLFQGVRALEDKADEGNLSATSSRSRFETLDALAQLFCEVYRDFSWFMNAPES